MKEWIYAVRLILAVIEMLTKLNKAERSTLDSFLKDHVKESV